MGYKLAGYDVIGNCEIDSKINDMYVKNHHPRLNYCMDIRELNKIPDLPDELYNLDVLDGSPPCSTFSLAGDREKNWGKQKAFREGQAKQALDDLFFEFINTAEKLKPKIIIAENVKGIILGNAKGYVNEIVKHLHVIGYDVQIFLLNAAFMGVPQRRERVFFLAQQKELALPDINLVFNEPPISFGAVRSEEGIPLGPNSKYRCLLEHRRPGDTSIADVYKRIYGRESGYNNSITADDTVAATITSNGIKLRMNDGYRYSAHDYIACSTFPEDYDFNGMDVQYVCGMSVPPYMMQRIAEQIRIQWLDKR